MDDLPPFLPPRRPTSVPNLPKERPSWQSFRTISPTVYDTPPPFLPPRRPSSARLQPSTGYHSTHTAGGDSLVHSRSGTLSRPDSLQSIPDTESTVPNEPVVERSDSARRRRLSSHQPLNVPQQPLRDRILQDGQLLGFEQTSPSLRQPPVLRHSSLRIASRIPEDADEHVFPGKSTLGNSHSDPSLCPDQYRPHSHPPARAATRAYSTNVLPPIAPLSALSADLETTDPYKLPPLSYGERTSPLKSPVLAARPRASLSRLSSLDNIITFREEKAQWKRASSILQQSVSEPALDAGDDHERVAVSVDAPPSVLAVSETAGYNVSGTEPPAPSKHRSTFRHSVGEIGFCFTIAMTQFLAEYLISGFAIELPRLFYDQFSVGPGSLGLFWPASLLSLILSATLLIFARLSDMYGGYPSFMFGIVWLTIWTLIPGFNRSSVMLDVARAMQGVAMAAFMPSTFAMVGSFYSEGPRKNFVLGLYSGCAPLGFFAGFLTAGALPASKPHWYFWIASALSCVTAITAYLAVPHDRTDRKTLGLKMDWPGSFLITAGLILLAYALAVEPYTNQFDHSRDGFSYPMVYGPFSSGVLCLLLALVWEGWFAMCPLLPFDFFRPPGVKAFCLAGLCFYASYGVWLYDSAEFFQSPTGTTASDEMSGIQLALWYTPTAIAGLVLCVVGGALLHIVPVMILLLISALAWIGAPLLLALCPLPLNYWSAVLPSMLCATLGIDLTFTVSLVFLSSIQPQRYQGLCGAVCSILVNLAMSFSLPVSEIVTKRAQSGMSVGTEALSGAAEQKAVDDLTNMGFKAAFLYAAASAGLGFVICVLFVRISRSTVRKKPVDQEQTRPPTSESEASTLVEGRDERHVEETPVQSAELDR